MGIYRGRVQDLLTIPVSVSPPGSGPAAVRERLVTFVLDSGSSYLFAHTRRHSRVGPPLQRRVRVSTQLSESAASLYEASFAFPTCTLAPIPKVTVASLPMPQRLAAYKGVIGRDLLRAWETFYGGPRGQLTIRDYRSFWGWLFS